MDYGGNGAPSKRVCAVDVAVQGKESGGIGGNSRSKVARVKKRNHGAGSNRRCFLNHDAFCLIQSVELMTALLQVCFHRIDTDDE